MSTAAIIHGTTVAGEGMFPPIWAVLARDQRDVLVRLQRRDPQALTELYDRYGAMVYRLVLRMVRDSGIAQDLVQETFLRVWNRAAGFDSGRGAIGPWLLAIARNRALDYLRAQGRRGGSAIELNETEHPALFVDFAAEALNLDVARQVRRALDELPSQQREALELAYFEGMSQTEIAERMRQPLGTIKTWMRRGLSQMRDKMDAGGAVNR